jgi:hypothetical protein
MVAAVTEMIDDYDLGQLGERLARYRLPTPSAGDVGMIQLLVWENLHDQAEIRARRSEVVAAFLAQLSIPDPLPDPTDDERARLGTLANLGAVCRSPVVRDRFKGDHIVRVPASEGVGRLLGQMEQLLVAMRVIGEVWCLLARSPSTACTLSGGEGWSWL